MIARLQNLWEKLRASLWFFPGLLALCGGFLAWLALSVRLDLGGNFWWIYGGSLDAASNLLSSFLTSLISVAALSISITMVVLTLAAQQLGPRLIRTFVSSWQTQFSLGTFMAAILYLVLVLRSLPNQSDSSVPNLAITIGTGFVILCSFSLLFLIHHLSGSIVSDHIIERVGGELHDAIERLLPDEGQRIFPLELIARTAGNELPRLSLKTGGYVQAVDYHSLVRAAEEEDTVLHLHLRPGKFVFPQGRQITLLRGEPSKKLQAAVEEAITVGQQRTTPQDLEYAIRQLVEVAMRAMYVWDVYTCIAVIDRLTLSLADIMQRGEHRRGWQDRSGELRVLADSVSFEGMADEAFNQIRQGGSKFPAILIHMAQRLEAMFENAPSDRHRTVLARHAWLVIQEGRRSIPEPEDLAVLESEAKGALAFAMKTQLSAKTS